MNKIKLFTIIDKETTKKQKMIDFFVTFGLCTLGVGLVFALSEFTKIPTSILMTPVEVYGEMSNPSVVRAILGGLDIILIFLFSVLASKSYKKERLNLSTFFAYLSGTFLWQLIGECIWHFGTFRIETAPALPLAILISALLIYCHYKKTFSWPLLIIIVAFMSNWLGHLCLLTPALLLKNYLPEQITYIIFGTSICFLFLAYCAYRFIFRTINTKERVLCSMGIFISIATLAFAFIEGFKTA